MYNVNFRNTTNRYSIEDLFNNLQRVWDFKGSQPFVVDMDKEPSTICFTTYFNRFGSWKNAIIEFVKFKNGDVNFNQPLKLSKIRKTINNSLRYDVMKRDKFKCHCCGKSPAIDDNVLLEIDHIVAVSKGGDNHIDNLRTICKGCNIGKYNKS